MGRRTIAGFEFVGIDGRTLGTAKWLLAAGVGLERLARGCGCVEVETRRTDGATVGALDGCDEGLVDGWITGL